jgi:hypothetical protein
VKPFKLQGILEVGAGFPGSSAAMGQEFCITLGFNGAAS